MGYGSAMVKVGLKSGMIIPQSEYRKTKALPPGKAKKDKFTPKRTEAKAKQKKKTKAKNGERTPMDTRLV